MVWEKLLSNNYSLTPQTPTVDLRTQLQPFQDLQPDEIQDQLQRLHIQHPDATTMVMFPPTTATTPSHTIQYDTASSASSSSVESNGYGGAAQK